MATIHSPSHHLGRYLTAFAAIVVGPVLLLALIFGAVFVSLERERLQDEAIKAAVSLRGNLDREFSGMIATLRALSTSPALDNRDFELFQQQAEPLASDRMQIILRDRSGQQLVNTRIPWGQTLPKVQIEADEETLSKRSAVISDLFIGPVTSRLLFVINLPVIRNGEVIYFLSFSLSPEALEPFAHSEKLPDNWVVRTSDRKGQIVARSVKPEFIGRKIPDQDMERAKASSGSFVTQSLEGTEVFYAYAYSQLSGWRVGVLVPRQEIEVPLWNMLAMLGMLAAVIMTATIIAVVFINGRLRSSVKKLIGASQLLGRGEIIPPLATGVKELDNVSEAMSAASVGLREKTLQIQENEGRLRTLLDNLFVYVGLLDLQGRILEANAAPMKAAGLKREDVIGRYIWDTYWWSWSPDVKEQIQKAVREAGEGKTIRFDIDIRMAGGVLHTIDFQLAPLRAGDGSIVYLLPSAVDITDRKLTEQKLQESLAQLEATYTSAPVGLCLLDRQLRFIAVNQHLASINKKTIEEHIGKSLKDVLGEAAAQQLEPQFRKILKTGKSVDRLEISRTDSEDPSVVRTFLVSYHPLLSARGDVIGISVAMLEITDRKLAEERQQILSRELQHRVKNNLATVQAIAGATARSASSTQDFIARFSERIASLARTHTLVTETGFAGADLREIIKSEITPYDAELKRVVIDGPSLRLPTETALILGMAMHELTTNAVKYGALSNPTGRVSISWRVESGELVLTWWEQGGPKAKAPQKKGFGSQLLQKILTQQLKGSVDLNFGPDGAMVTIKIPADALLLKQAAA